MLLALLIYGIGIAIILLTISFTYFGRCYVQYWIDFTFLHPNSKKYNYKWLKVATAYSIIIIKILLSWYTIIVFIDAFKDIKKIQKVSNIPLKVAIRSYFSITPEDIEDIYYH